MRADSGLPHVRLLRAQVRDLHPQSRRQGFNVTGQSEDGRRRGEESNTTRSFLHRLHTTQMTNTFLRLCVCVSSTQTSVRTPGRETLTDGSTFFSSSGEYVNQNETYISVLNRILQTDSHHIRQYINKYMKNNIH